MKVKDIMVGLQFEFDGESYKITENAKDAVLHGGERVPLCNPGNNYWYAQNTNDLNRVPQLFRFDDDNIEEVFYWKP